MPQVSVLLPVFNGARFLRQQLKTILDQSLDDLELLVVDDGSTDDSLAILTEAAAVDRRVTLVASTGNLGQKVRLAELGRQACAPFVAVADQDDLWWTEKLELLVSAINGGAPLSYGPSWIIDADGSDRGYTLLDALPPIPGPQDRLIYLFKASVSAHAALLRKDYFSLRSLQRSHAFDWLQSLDAAFAGGTVHVPAAKTMHRLHDSNQSDNHKIGIAHSLRHRASFTNVQRYRNRRLFDRWMLIQRLEFLAYSPLQDALVREGVQRAVRLCERGWFTHDRPVRFNNRDLRNGLYDCLLPLAGSSEDEAVARAAIARLCQSPSHLRSIVGDVRAALRG